MNGSTTVSFEGKQYSLSDNETILDCLLRHGVEISFGCRAGVCQSCLLKIDRYDTLPAGLFQTGLKPEQKSEGYVLCCQSKPQECVSLKRIDQAKNRYEAIVLEKEWLNERVFRLRLHCKLPYRPGQYAVLWRDETCGRAYSLASSDQEDEYLEFHIKYFDDGRFSSWAANELCIGEKLTIQGPLGTCFYSQSAQQPLLMMSSGTGLAPIIGILKDALLKGHLASIDVVVSARKSSELYYCNELIEMAANHKQLNIYFLAQDNDAGVSNIFQIDPFEFAKEKIKNITERKIFLCGAEQFVLDLRKKLFLSGVNFNAISADAFLNFKED